MPLFILAMVWDRLGLGGKKLIRGWGFEFGPIKIHSTNLFAGIMHRFLNFAQKFTAPASRWAL